MSLSKDFISPNSTSSLPLVSLSETQMCEAPLTSHAEMLLSEEQQLILSYFVGQERLLTFKKNKLERVLDLEAMRAFFSYRMLCPADFIEFIELQRDHGFFHIRNVAAYYNLNVTNSPELTESNDIAKETLRYASAEALAIRFHDLIQQYLLYLGCGKESKTFHGELAGLYLLLVAPELMQHSGYSLRTIYRAAAICFKHSYPEEVGDNFILPDIQRLAKQLQSHITKYKKTGKGQDLPDNIVDFFPIPPNASGLSLTREVFEERLKVGNNLNLPRSLKAKESKILAYHIGKVAFSDMSDSIFPPAKANFRTLHTKEGRSLFIDITTENSLKWLQYNLDEVQMKLKDDRQNSHLIAKERKILSLIQRVKELDDKPFPTDLEFEIIVLVASNDAPYDFARVLFESLRGYKKDLQLTEFESQQLGTGMVRRLEHFVEIVTMLGNEPDVNSIQEALQEIAASNDKNLKMIAQFLCNAGKTKQEFFKKENLAATLERIKQLASYGISRIQEMYGEKNEEEFKNPIGDKEYDFGHQSFRLARAKMESNMYRWYERYTPKRTRQRNLN